MAQFRQTGESSLRNSVIGNQQPQTLRAGVRKLCRTRAEQRQLDPGASRPVLTLGGWVWVLGLRFLLGEWGFLMRNRTDQRDLL